MFIEVFKQVALYNIKLHFRWEMRYLLLSNVDRYQ